MAAKSTTSKKAQTTTATATATTTKAASKPATKKATTTKKSSPVSSSSSKQSEQKQLKTTVAKSKSYSIATEKEAKILCIVESPNKKATLTKIFKDLGYKNLKVEASVGHITEIKDNKSTKWNTGIHVDDNFRIDYVISEDKKKVVATLKDAIKSVDYVFLATDPDREGESIAAHLKQELHIPESKYYRITFHEITKSGVQASLENIGKIDTNLADAAEARAGADKFIGYSLSGLGRKAVGAKSVGRVQSPALKLVVDREEAIQSFVPEKYFELYLDFTKNLHDYRAKYVGTDTAPLQNFKSEQEAERVVAECGKLPYLIKSIISSDRQVSPKPPFTTSTLQQECSSKLGISVKQTAMYAQKLFEGINVGGQHTALITYIRTDSTEMSPEFALELGQYVRRTFGDNYFAPVKKGKKTANSQEGHECIRVVDLEMTPQKLSSMLVTSDDNTRMLKVYEIIYNRTLASSMAPAIVTDTDYNIYNQQHKFVYTSHALKFEGFKKVYGQYKEEDEQDYDNAVRDLMEGEQIRGNLSIEAKETKPPRRFSEAGLVAALEKAGIGRPSTYPTIISTLTDKVRNYTTTENKSLVPTELGSNLTHYLDNNFKDIVGIDYTAKMESELDKIANGEMSKLDFFNQFYSNLIDTISKVDKDIASAPSSNSSGYTCPNCGKAMVWRKGPYGTFLACSGYPKCKTAIKKPH